MKKKQNSYEEMSIDNFFNSLDVEPEKAKETNGKVDIKKKKKSKDKEKDKTKSSGYKKKESALDPELYEFLQQNDKKLLNFALSKTQYEKVEEKSTKNCNDNEDEEEDEDDDLHKPSDKLEVASDESDFEPDDIDEDEITDEKKARNAKIVTLKRLQEWENALHSEDVSIEVIRNVIKAFDSALISIAGDNTVQGEFIVKGSAIFNGIIQLCVLNVERGLRSYLKLTDKAKLQDIQKHKKFSKVKNVLRTYMMNLIKLLEMSASNNILSVILKHLHQIAGLLVAFSSIRKPVIKRLINLWSTSEESIRIIAFLCILKIARTNQDIHEKILKTMYMEYVKNSKFVSPNTLPAINFMRRSLTELYLLDLKVAYYHMFLYVRQLAIHLRNAKLLQKKDHFQQVYNWQYVNSLKLWADVISNVHKNNTTTSAAKVNNKSKIQSLIYPLVSIINGVIKLKSGVQFYPLRFHCIKILIDLSRATKVFIPILPHIMEMLNSNIFNQQHKKLAMKPISFTCLLRIQKGHLDENSFRDEVIEKIYALSVDCLVNECTSIAFPDLVVPYIMALNDFNKKSKNANYVKKMKQLVEKVNEQSNYINMQKNKITFALHDVKSITNFENHFMSRESPFEVFYKNWVVANVEKQKTQKIVHDESTEMEVDALPIKKKLDKKSTKKENGDSGVTLFPSDDEDDSDDDNFNFGEDDDSDSPDEDVKNKKKNNKANGKKIAQLKESSNEDDDDDDDDFSMEGDDNGEDKMDIVEDLEDW
jgi:nucleolar complex protein 2